jgi:hypothetical protein
LSLTIIPKPKGRAVIRGFPQFRKKTRNFDIQGISDLTGIDESP